MALYVNGVQGSLDCPGTVQSAHECDMIMRCKTSKLVNRAHKICLSGSQVRHGLQCPQPLDTLIYEAMFVQLLLDAVSSEQISLSARFSR